MSQISPSPQAAGLAPIGACFICPLLPLKSTNAWVHEKMPIVIALYLQELDQLVVVAVQIAEDCLQWLLLRLVGQDSLAE